MEREYSESNLWSLEITAGQIQCLLWQKPTGELYCVDVSCCVGLYKNDITHTKDNLAICLSIYEMDHHFKKKESES